MQMQIQGQTSFPSSPAVSGHAALGVLGGSGCGESHQLSKVISSWQRHSHPHPHTGPQFSLGLRTVHEHEQNFDPHAEAPVITTLRRLDRFIGGFPPASISLLASHSEFLFNLVARIIVNTVNSSQRDVIYIDGGNTLDPYLLTTACRLFRVDADSVLRSVQVARAFTVFQLDALITQSLERILSQHKPRLVLVACISDLFLDRDVNWGEARTLFESDFWKLKKLTERYNVTTLLTNFGNDRSIHRFELDRLLRKRLPPEHRLSIKMPSRLKLRFVKGNGEFLDYFPLPPYQWTLDDFCAGGDLYG